MTAMDFEEVQTPSSCARRRYHPLLLLLLLTHSSSASSPTVVAYFVGVSSCPAGWSRYAALDGRAVLPVVDSSTAGVAYGAALADGADAAHAHTLSLSAAIPSKCVSVASGCGNGGDNGWLHEQTVGFSAAAASAGGNWPLQTLLTCGMDPSDPANAGFGLPAGAMTFFDALAAPRCHDAWLPIKPQYAGRLFVPFSASGGAAAAGALSAAAPIVPGAPLAAHSHRATGGVSVPSANMNNYDSNCNCYGVASNGWQPASGSSGTDAGGLPYLSLMTCQAAPGGSGTAPLGMVVFVDQPACPAGWTAANLPQPGSFAVSLRSGATPGARGTPMAAGATTWAAPAPRCTT